MDSLKSADNKNEPRFYAPYIILFFISIASSMLPPLLGALFLKPYGFLPDALHNAKLNAYTASIGFYFVGSIFGGYICGVLCDHVGEKKVLLFYCISSLIALLLSCFSLAIASLPLFLLSRIIDGFSTSRVALLSLLARFNEPKSSVFRKAEIMNALGLFVGPLACGFLVNFKSEVPLYYYATPFLIALAMNTINLFFILGFKERKIIKGEGRVKLEDYKHPIFIEFSLYQLAWYFYFIAIVPLAIYRFGFNSSQLGILFSAMIAIYILFLNLIRLLPTQVIEAQIGQNLVILVGIIALISIGFFRTMPIFFLGNFFILLATSVLTPEYLAAVSKVVSKNHYGVVMGIQTTIIACCSAAAAFISGLMLDFFLGLPLYSAALLLSILLFYRLCSKVTS